MRITALVPLKRDSRRLPNKNFLLLGGKPLAYHIFNALLGVTSIDQVCAYSSTDEFMSQIPGGVNYVARDPRLDEDHIRGLDLLRAFANQEPSDFYILAHATSPFLTTTSLQSGVDGILSGGYDSALSVSKIQKYFWYDEQPVNYDVNDIIQTQHIQPALVETSGFYMFSKDDISQRSRRIGDHPKFVPVDLIEGIDIDDLEEFLFARRFQDRLGESSTQIAWPATGKSTIRFALFDLEGPLIDSDGSISEYATQWLNILKNHGIKVGVLARSNQAHAERSLDALKLFVNPNVVYCDEAKHDRLVGAVLEACADADVNPTGAAFLSSSEEGLSIANSVGTAFIRTNISNDGSAASRPGSFPSIGDISIRLLESARPSDSSDESNDLKSQSSGVGR